MNNIKIAKCSNIIIEEDDYFYMNKLDALQYLNKRIRAGYGRVKIHDVEFINSPNNDVLFRLIVLFEPLTH